MPHSGNSGEKAERAAEIYLQQQGLSTLATRWHCRRGELDLVMLDAQQTLVFVEVKMRGSASYGLPQEMVGPAKQKKILLAAQYYLEAFPQYQRYNMRFDVVAVKPIEQQNTARIKWLTNAFDASVLLG